MRLRTPNTAHQISTTLSPSQLLAFVKRIEAHIGRRKTINKGPREIDLDILLYDDDGKLVMRDEQFDLTIPHPLIAEREFVLRPLAEWVTLCNAMQVVRMQR